MGKLDFKYRAHWHESPAGRQLIATIESELQHTLPGIFGFYLLQLGREEYSQWHAESHIQQKIIVGSSPLLPNKATNNLIHSEFQRLPFPDDSIDAIFLPCILETEAYPFDLLKEVWRVLLPSGTLIIFGFNPWSLQGLKHVFLQGHDEFPWQGHYWSSYRVKKWLTETGFTVESLTYSSLKSNSAKSHINFMEKIRSCCYHRYGSLYQITATKRVMPVMPIKPKWKMAIEDDALVSTTSQLKL